MLYIYMLSHVRLVDNEVEDVKGLGTFDTKEKALKMIEEYKKLPGFKDYPQNFIIEKEEINKPYWIKGFNNTGEIQIKKYKEWRDQ